MTSLTAMPKYEVYKDSGGEWLGNIPGHWRVIRLKNAAFINPVSDISSCDLDEVVCFLPMEKVGTDGAVEYDQYRTLRSVKQGFTSFQNNDVIIAKITPCFENGKGAHLKNMPTKFGYGSTEFHVLRAYKNYNPAFLYYLTKSHLFMDLGEQLMTGSAGQKRVPTSFISDFLFASPSEDEQTAIANFLDEKTAKIDEAIAIKQKQIELLKERKQIIIQQAVTQGLDLTVPMKDSGVEWIGMIPAHWTCINFRQIIDILTDYTANGSFADLAKNVTYLDEPSYSRLVRLTDLRKNLENDGVFLNKKSHIYLRKSELFGGELLMANVGAYAGLAWLMPKINMPATLAPNMFMIKVNYEKGLTEYISALINSECYWCYIKTIAQASAQPKLNKENIRSLKILLPPIDEQHKIFEYLKLINEEYEGAINLHLEQIEKLKEYKTTLINSAVTGKIKVV